jgi:hypothetical protein
MGWQIIVVVAANMSRLGIFFWIFQQMSNKEGRRVNCLNFKGCLAGELYRRAHDTRCVHHTAQFPYFLSAGFFFLKKKTFSNTILCLK